MTWARILLAEAIVAVLVGDLLTISLLMLRGT